MTGVGSASSTSSIKKDLVPQSFVSSEANTQATASIVSEPSEQLFIMHLFPILYQLFLANVGYVVSANPTFLHHSHKADSSFQHLAKRAEACPPLNTPFWCPLNNPNVVKLDYGSLQLLPGGTTGNPATIKFCIGKTCNPSGTVKIEIDGTETSCDNIGATDPIVTIKFLSIPGYKYQEEHIWVGQDTSKVPNGPGRYPFTTGNGYCTANTDEATCTIPLKALLSAAGINGICPNSGPQQFYIVTHASLINTVTGSTVTGTSDGPCLSARCNPWFAYATVKYQCVQCKPCITCTCPEYAAAHKCECNPDCSCPNYAAAHKCECNPDCSCPNYVAVHKCECPDYATAHKCECNPDCTCPEYAAVNPDKCLHWCGIGTAFGYVPPNSQPPVPINFNGDPQGPALSGNGCNRWGWYYNVPKSSLPTAINGLLEVGAGGNDVSKALEVGTFNAQLTSSTLTFTYTLHDNTLDLGEVHVYASCSEPKTCAPGQYTYSGPASTLGGNDDQTFSSSFSVEDCTDSSTSYYLIFHATINKALPTTTCPNPVT